MSLTTRKPTGKPSWPILLLAGVEKSGKTYAAAAASGSDLIGRTIWVGIGEDDPDEYGAIPGARFEIAIHDGTYRSILSTLSLAVAELRQDSEPGLIVVDSGTRLWNLLSDEAQDAANTRARAKARRYNRSEPEGDVTISMDLWNTAKQRWEHVMDVLREHQGPSIITARLDFTSVVDDRGEPTKERVWKVQAHKSLPFDVGATVEMTAPGEAYLTGVRSLRIRDAQVARKPMPKFNVDALWREMGLADDAGERSHSQTRIGGTEPELVEAQRRVIKAWAARHDGDEDLARIASAYESDTGSDIRQADVAALTAYAENLESQHER